ncbi:hypothetical protein Acid345_3665 [Candidatus Koribacter versatilis Ellin345]|uniref:DUF4412 domain-containing protein n=1 Tax=Koribacter versatilis (strain Ellin345) TaxID=204669 RepID=Q1IKD4_KORVE|nr:hypothetical protein [Candidatus Koribacter versatilis]ABF42666.1 hypothetical protein Acid345_3665 [Candidatus Koribacter versatilis Ellin345]
MRKLIAVFMVLAGSSFMLAQSEPITIHGEGFQHAGAMRIDMAGPENMKVVKGIPLTADIVNTHVQHLADGNKITNEETSHLYRDSEGRTRRENKIVLPGSNDKNVPTMIMINDPVAHTRFILNTDRKSADELPGHPPMMSKDINVMYTKKGADEAAANPHESEAETKEDLGTQSIEGFVAKGTKATHVIPAGKIGNEKPITVTTESWYSDELGLEVMRVHNDPWSGEVTTKITNVRRGEPDASLFTPPADYKVEKMNGNRTIRIERNGPGEPPPPPAPEN